MTNKICSFTALCAFILIATFLISGCAEKKKEEKIVATINNYNMTVEDFRYESNEISNVGRVLGEMPVTKRDMLDVLITKEVLLQEAVKQNLDKEKDFMRSIELYWEQALLKNLLARKSQEIAKATAVYEDEINRYYNNMKNKIKAGVIVFSGEKYADKGMKEKDSVLAAWEQEPQKFAISYTIQSKWYILGEGQSPLEYDIFMVDRVKGKGVVKMNGKWALVIIEDTAPNDVGTLASLKSEIIRRIRAVKGRESMEQWIELLRLKARIKVDEKIFDSLN